MAWLRHLCVEDLRVLKHVEVELGPGLNVFSGRNAQGKTSILEAVALIARGRSFRTEEFAALVSRGKPRCLATGRSERKLGSSLLAVEVTAMTRRFACDGRIVPLREYHGQLEAVVYSTDRLRVIHGGMRERRLWLDRSASALDATYRRLCQVYEQTLRQRNAALERRSSDLPAWDEAFAESGASLRVARAAYADKLNAALLASTYRPTSEHYSVLTRAESRDPDTVRQKLHLELGRLRTAELAAGRSLAGPHRDPIDLTIDGEDAARFASSGQSRSLLLALTLAALSIHEAETGETAIALLDDLDSELDETRAARICEVVAARGQALLTTAHSEWARSICGQGTLFHVDAGEVKAA